MTFKKFMKIFINNTSTLIKLRTTKKSCNDDLVTGFFYARTPINFSKNRIKIESKYSSELFNWSR